MTRRACCRWAATSATGWRTCAPPSPGWRRRAGRDLRRLRDAAVGRPGPAAPTSTRRSLVAADGRRPTSWLARAQRARSAAPVGYAIPQRRFGPRTLDVDVIMVWADDGLPVISDDPELTLPHPRAHLRAFVLRPWLDIQPYAQLPGHGWVTDLMRTPAGRGRPAGSVAPSRSVVGRRRDRRNEMERCRSNGRRPDPSDTRQRPQTAPDQAGDAGRRGAGRGRGRLADHRERLQQLPDRPGCRRSSSSASACCESVAAITPRRESTASPARRRSSR